MYKYLFGPVPSRRLGVSLGIDLVPKKVCTLDCVYCEVGKTNYLTLERKAYVSLDLLKNEIEDYFLHHEDPDYITFSGSGEPTLNSEIGNVLEYIKLVRPNLPIAVLTNGTLFDKKEVRQAILGADLVLPSLDAATQKGFNKINQPHPNLDINHYIEGLVAFREEYKNKIWLEVFILPGYNDNQTELTALQEAITRIKPDLVQLNTLDRPGNLHDLTGSTPTELQSIIEFWKLDNVQIIASYAKNRELSSFNKDIESTIIQTISRRPCTLDDLSSILGLHPNEIMKYLSVLETENKIKKSHQKRGIFYLSQLTSA
jgi:wyosine [tRNA(Phe)-imidazoG37] synthetase (radical SAM superfamily)